MRRALETRRLARAIFRDGAAHLPTGDDERARVSARNALALAAAFVSEADKADAVERQADAETRNANRAAWQAEREATLARLRALPPEFRLRAAMEARDETMQITIDDYAAIKAELVAEPRAAPAFDWSRAVVRSMAPKASGDDGDEIAFPSGSVYVVHRSAERVAYWCRDDRRATRGLVFERDAEGQWCVRIVGAIPMLDAYTILTRENA